MGMPDSSVQFNPFPGLRAFKESEDYLFFGREEQCSELLKRLCETRFLAVVGISGSGKSSLVKAGLLPSLQGGFMVGSGPAWRIASFRPGNNPLGEMAHALYQSGIFGGQEDKVDAKVRTAIIESTLRRSSRGLIEVLRHARISSREPVLIMVDQFEEILRFHEPDKDLDTHEEAAAFVKLLLEASETKAHSVFIVLTMRSDFLGDCAQFRGLSEAINDGQYLVPRMTRVQRKQAIERPVAVGMGRISDRLVQRLLNDSGDNPDQLPVMQHALMRTWNQWQRTMDPEMDLCHYKTIGGIDEALSQHADEVYGKLSEARRKIAERLFKTLSTKGEDNRGIRRPTQFASLVQIAETTEPELAVVIDAFRAPGCSFLVPPAGVKLSEDTVIDISHESLMRVWKRMQDWVEEEAESARKYMRLAETARLHRNGRVTFLRDPELQMTLDWKREDHPNPAWAEQYQLKHKEGHEEAQDSEQQGEYTLALQFLAESEGERERERVTKEKEARRLQELEKAEAVAAEKEEKLVAQQKAARNQRRVLAITLVGFFVALGLATWALVERKKARDQKEIAESAQELALQEKEKAEQAREEAVEQRKRAQRQQSLAEDARAEEAEAREEAVKAERLAIERLEEKEKLLKEKEALITTLKPLTAQQGRLYVNVQPPDARIRILGIREAYTDGIKLDERKDGYQIEASHPDYQTKERWVTIVAGKENTEDIALEPLPGRIRISTEPEGAIITMNGEEKGPAPLSLVDLQPGQYQFRIEMAGYKTLEREIAVSPNQTEEVTFQLVPMSQLRILPDPKDATIRFLNLEKEYKPGMALPPGRYHIEVSKKDYETVNQWITLAVGEEKQLEINLVRKDLSNSVGMKFVLVKPGTFMMGSPDDEPHREDNENQHEVTLTDGFYLQTTEVTVGQWREFVSTVGYKSEAEKEGWSWIWSGSRWEKKEGYYWDKPGFEQAENHPVTCISWNDTQAYIDWLSKKEGMTYRLPTEAEWEYACQAGTPTPFSFGKCLSTDDANYNGNYPLTVDCPKGKYRKKSVAVASFRPNAWGLYDMHGNVWEWCSDWYARYEGNRVENPIGPSTGASRVIRGGGWSNYAWYCRSAYRSYGDPPDNRHGSLGFRLCRSAKQTGTLSP